jgi:hypothetical protein
MTEPDLAYHLRELQADLRSARAMLDRLEGGEEVRAWVELEALLEHDLDVHLPAAAKLAGEPEHEPAPRRDAQSTRAIPVLRELLATAIAAVSKEPPVLAAASDAVADAHALARDGRRRATEPAGG